MGSMLKQARRWFNRRRYPLVLDAHTFGNTWVTRVDLDGKECPPRDVISVDERGHVLLLNREKSTFYRPALTWFSGRIRISFDTPEHEDLVRAWDARNRTGYPHGHKPNRVRG